MTEITKEQFEAYVDVQESGVTNMFEVKTVSELAGLEKEEIKQQKSKVYGQKPVKGSKRNKKTGVYNS